ncbi:MAG: hypothetical protein V3S81_06730, partial [Anaerolineales bacterium]
GSCPRTRSLNYSSDFPFLLERKIENVLILAQCMKCKLQPHGLLPEFLIISMVKKLIKSGFAQLGEISINCPIFAAYANFTNAHANQRNTNTQTHQQEHSYFF